MTGVLDRTPTFDELLTHMRRYYSDWSIANDLDSVLQCVTSKQVREGVLLYARLRKNARGFNPSSSNANSHSAIGTASLALFEPGKTVVTVTCEACGKGFAASRSDAKFCSARCRQRASRARTVTPSSWSGVPVSETSSPTRQADSDSLDGVHGRRLVTTPPLASPLPPEGARLWRDVVAKMSVRPLTLGDS